jgi:hypothetical protein
MKTEQAIKLLHRLQDEQFDGIHGDERREALNMAVRAIKMNEFLAKALDGTPLYDPCNKLFAPEGWCKKHCKTDHPTAECWLKYAEVVADDGTV